MELKKINYSESIKTPTGKQYESKLLSFGAEIELKSGDDADIQTSKLKAFVKEKLAEEFR